MMKVEQKMGFKGDTGGALKKMWIFFGLTLIFSTIPSPSTAQTLQTLLGEVGASTQQSCYVCSSVDSDCDTSALSQTLVKQCNVISGADSYLETVYGSMALKDTSKDLKMWPQSLTELATGGGGGGGGSSNTTAPTPSPAPTIPPSANGTSSKNGTSESGWTYATFPGSYQEKVPSAAKEKYTISGLSLGRLENKTIFDKGFNSCRVMKISTDSQKNDGKTQEIPSTKPRIVRTCSFVPIDELGENYKEGCRTINFKTATLSICYCSGTDNTKPCNRSSRLQLSAVFLAATLLTLVGIL